MRRHRWGRLLGSGIFIGDTTIAASATRTGTATFWCARLLLAEIERPIEGSRRLRHDQRHAEKNGKQTFHDLRIGA